MLFYTGAYTKVSFPEGIYKIAANPASTGNVRTYTRLSFSPGKERASKHHQNGDTANKTREKLHRHQKIESPLKKELPPGAPQARSTSKVHENFSFFESTLQNPRFGNPALARMGACFLLWSMGGLGARRRRRGAHTDKKARGAHNAGP